MSASSDPTRKRTGGASWREIDALGNRTSTVLATEAKALRYVEIRIPCAKTPAGRRTLEVPAELRPLLEALSEGKATGRYLFECQRPHERAKPKPQLRGWVIDQVHRICDLAKVPRVTAHAMRGLLATLKAERGLAGYLIAATLGHEDERITMHAYAAPGPATAGALRRGLVVLNGGVQATEKKAQ